MGFVGHGATDEKCPQRLFVWFGYSYLIGATWGVLKTIRYFKFWPLQKRLRSVYPRAPFKVTWSANFFSIQKDHYHNRWSPLKGKYLATKMKLLRDKPNKWLYRPHKHGVRFGRWFFMWQVWQCGMEGIRGVHDSWNQVLAGGMITSFPFLFKNSQMFYPTRKYGMFKHFLAGSQFRMTSPLRPWFVRYTRGFGFMLLLEGLITGFMWLYGDKPLWIDYKPVLLWQDPFFDMAQNDVEMIRAKNWGLNEADEEDVDDIDEFDDDEEYEDEENILDKHEWDHISDILL